jgi:hypothetical protein
MMLWAKFSLNLNNQAPACVAASSINTPGSTGNSGKWSPRYSSLNATVFVAVIETLGSYDLIESNNQKRMAQIPITRLQPNGLGAAQADASTPYHQWWLGGLGGIANYEL